MHPLARAGRAPAVMPATLPMAPTARPAAARLPPSRSSHVPCGLMSCRYLRGEWGVAKDNLRRHSKTVAATGLIDPMPREAAAAPSARSAARATACACEHGGWGVFPLSGTVAGASAVGRAAPREHRMSCGLR